MTIARHASQPARELTLALLVTGVALADHHDTAVATDHLAVLANRLDAGLNLHDFLKGSLSSYLRGFVGRYFRETYL